MLEFTAVPRRVRRDTLVNAFIDWVSYGREDARATFSDAYGQQINWRCSIEHHIDAARTPLQRPPTPQNEDKVTENISCSQYGSEDILVPAPKNSDDLGEETSGDEAHTDDPRDSPLSVQSSSNFENTANETWDNREANSSEDTEDDEFDLGGAPGWEEWGAPPPAKEGWGPHCGHKYGMTNTEYKNTAWRYDVVTDIEIYRVSTIPNDFIGSSPWNNWTHEVLVACRWYKEVDHMSEELENAAKVLSADEADSRNDFHRTRYKAAVRAATLRIEFLRKWPNAFEQHDGTFNHWERALELLQRAERARLDGLQAFENWPRTCFEHQDRPDVPVSATSNLQALGVETMSAVAFASLHTNDGLENTALGEAVRLSLEQCYIAKFRPPSRGWVSRSTRAQARIGVYLQSRGFPHGML